MNLISKFRNWIGFPAVSELVDQIADEIRTAPHAFSYIRGELRATCGMYGRLTTRIWREGKTWFIETYGVPRIMLNRREAALIEVTINDWWDGFRHH